MKIARHAQNQLGMRLADHHRTRQSRQHRTQIKSALNGRSLPTRRRCCNCMGRVAQCGLEQSLMTGTESITLLVL
jgi:hypothetical protein